jgi:hypothetical protein
MFSIRNLSRSTSTVSLGVLALAGTIVATGCQRIQRPQPDRLNDTPLVVDEAMQIRDWDRSTSVYANGATVAGATRLTFEPSDDGPINYAADPAIGLTNFVIIPFTYFWIPPFTKIEYHGAIIPPTYMAVPPAQVVR